MDEPEASSGGYLPRVVQADLVPFKGKQFDSLEDAYIFYNNYAKKVGFSTRIGKQTKDKAGKGIIMWKQYVCSKEGMKDTKAEPNKRRIGITREDCPARMVVTKNCENFVVSKFVARHSHPLTTPRKIHLLRSHRKVTCVKKSLTIQLAAANIAPSKQMSILELDAGGLGNIGFIERDLLNARRDDRKALEGQDAEMLKEYFQTEVEKNSGFRFAIKKDEEGRMTHCFWVNAACRQAYKYFGDVVVFDTTYNTNRYCMIFAPILGVNHHRQTILFGCGFLNDETSDSFEWFFKEWLKAMPAGPPKMIITDQDPAMTKAFANVLPNTLHRYCIWHIVQKFSEKIGAVAYKKSYGDLHDCIWNSETAEEFEEKWLRVVGENNLADNEWLNGLYDIRARWIPAYTRSIFSAHMTSSQRAEISHAFFKNYVSLNNSLWDFITRFDRAYSRIEHNELQMDHVDIYEKPELKTRMHMEEIFRELYTRAIFYKCQGELLECVNYMVNPSEEDEHIVRFDVKRIKYSGGRARVLQVEKSSGRILCSCMMFDSDGIVCRHVLAYFHRNYIDELPEHFIVRRWMKASRAERGVIDVSNSIGGGDSLLLTRHGLCMRYSKLVDDGLQTDSGTKIVLEALEEAEKKLRLIQISPTDACATQASKGSCPDEPVLKNPNKVRAKGCGKRTKGGKEKAMSTVKKSRRCHGCGKTGQTHDKRNCPQLINVSSSTLRLSDNEESDGYFED